MSKLHVVDYRQFQAAAIGPGVSPPAVLARLVALFQATGRYPALAMRQVKAWLAADWQPGTEMAAPADNTLAWVASHEQLENRMSIARFPL